jgi:two-component system, cell cycle response regulator DivK
MPKTVMIVEDNELNMKLFRDLLEAHGYHTVGTRDGIDALDLARKHRPDLVLMDIQLPEVSGLEVTRWLKEDPELKAIPVVAVTAFAMKSDEERIRQGGCEAYLSKPISVAKFIETVRRFIGIAGRSPRQTTGRVRRPSTEKSVGKNKRRQGYPGQRSRASPIPWQSLGPFNQGQAENYERRLSARAIAMNSDAVPALRPSQPSKVA